jgi:hypothetical protein
VGRGLVRSGASCRPKDRRHGSSGVHGGGRGPQARQPAEQTPAQPIEGAAMAATQKHQQPGKRVLGAAIQQVLKYELIAHDIGPVELRFLLLFDQHASAGPARGRHQRDDEAGGAR